MTMIKKLKAVGERGHGSPVSARRRIHVFIATGGCRPENIVTQRHARVSESGMNTLPR
jgi:hypothetical protein